MDQSDQLSSSSALLSKAAGRECRVAQEDGMFRYASPKDAVWLGVTGETWIDDMRGAGSRSEPERWARSDCATDCAGRTDGISDDD